MMTYRELLDALQNLPEDAKDKEVKFLDVYSRVCYVEEFTTFKDGESDMDQDYYRSLRKANTKEGDPYIWIS